MTSINSSSAVQNIHMLFFVSEEQEKNKISLLSQEIFLHVLSYLNISELGNTALVCKNWQHLIINNFISLNELLKEFNFIFSNVSNFEDANFYLFADKHSSWLCQWLCGMLIGFFAAKQRVIVLAEMSPSMEMIETDQELMGNYFIPPHLIDNVTFIGCDAKDIEQEIGHTIPVYKALLRGEEKWTNLIEKIEENIRAICSNVEDKDNLININKLSKLKDLLKECEERRELIRGDLARGLATKKEFKRTFPKRTTAMSTTLKSVQKKISEGEFEGKVVMRLGAQHIRPAERNKNIQEFQLDELFETLSSILAVAIIPKDIDNPNYL